MKGKSRYTSFQAVLLMVAFFISPAMSVAQQAAQSGVKIDPSAGPLTPGGNQAAPQQAPDAQSQLPEAPQPVPAAKPAPPPPAVPQEPLGVAAAEQIKTSGGGASRPAGNAIAPAKQRQYRSMLLKFGAIAAGGIAVGTVYALSHGTSSTPPHSASAAGAR
jgi:hypothetical protein